MKPIDSATIDATDADLLASVHHDDPCAFEILVRRYHPELFAFATRRLRDADAANDILQDVFLAVWRRHDTLASTPSLRAYLYRAVRNAITNVRRANKRTDRLFDQTGESSPNTVSNVWTEQPNDPLTQIEHADVLNAIEHAIATLPDRCREAWILVRERGLTYGEAASVLGISSGTVHTQVSRAFSVIRQAIKPFLVIAFVLLQ